MAREYDVGFISANFVARAAGYPGGEVDDWGEFDRQTREATTLADVEEWVGTVADAGFDGLSMWTAHCWYHDVTDEDVEAIRGVVEDAGLEIYSYGGGFGAPPEDRPEDRKAGWDRTFEVAAELGCNQLVGGCDSDELPLIAERIDEYGVDFGYENHPEGSAEEMLACIEGYEDQMGIGFDTGWAGTQQFDAAETIRTLDDRLVEIHLKDIETEGGHNTCALGEGVVGIRDCLDALDDVGYDGWITVEHEPFDHDPMPEVERSLEFVRKHA